MMNGMRQMIKQLLKQSSISISYSTQSMLISNGEFPELSCSLRMLIIFHRPTGLCTGGIINSEDVFYFSEFRTGSKSVEGRKRKWNGKIKDFINSLIGGDDAAKRMLIARYLSFVLLLSYSLSLSTCPSLK
jgi:hypothetical protein